MTTATVATQESRNTRIHMVKQQNCSLFACERSFYVYFQSCFILVHFCLYSSTVTLTEAKNHTDKQDMTKEHTFFARRAQFVVCLELVPDWYYTDPFILPSCFYSYLFIAQVSTIQGHRARLAAADTGPQTTMSLQRWTVPSFLQSRTAYSPLWRWRVSFSIQWGWGRPPAER